MLLYEDTRQEHAKNAIGVALRTVEDTNKLVPHLYHLGSKGAYGETVQ